MYKLCKMHRNVNRIIYAAADVCFLYIQNGRFEKQVSGAQVLGFRCQVPSFRCQVRRFQVSSSRFQVPRVRGQWPGVRCLTPGSMCHTQGIKDQIIRDHVSDFRDLVPRQNVENLHIKNILRLNGNYELTNTFFTTLMFSLACFNRKKNISSFYENSNGNKKI